MKERYRKNFSFESIIFALMFFGFFTEIATIMGLTNMLSTIMNTAFDLLMNTCLYIMAISVIAGALSGIFSEFGLIALVNILLSKIMKPIYNLPGASSLAVLNCYLSDNPAVLTLAYEDNFKRYFRKYQLPALTNLGTSFGMGLIVTTTMIAMPVENAFKAAVIGNLAAVIGSICSVRIMLHFTKKYYGTEEMVSVSSVKEIPAGLRIVREGSVGSRFIESLLDGGKSGVDMGLAIVPGVLCICTIVMLLTNGPNEAGMYTGAVGEGVALLPWIGEKLSFILVPLFGFSSNKSLAVPITALGSAGASLGVVSSLSLAQALSANDLAVFTAMCMCWSGYLSTHIAMMDALDAKPMTAYAIFSHTIAGLVAGVSAHIIAFLLL